MHMMSNSGIYDWIVLLKRLRVNWNDKVVSSTGVRFMIMVVVPPSNVRNLRRTKIMNRA